MRAVGTVGAEKNEKMIALENVASNSIKAASLRTLPCHQEAGSFWI